jgi:hypothetical protein
MKQLRQIIRYLGSVSFAILLLTSVMLVVVGGTVAESYADSHEYAMQTIYTHFLFTGLLALFFVNILVSALLRWPFKKKHIPFLLTHLGLLLVIGGTVIKNFKGTQGHLLIWEGSGSHQLMMPHSHALQITAKGSSTPLTIPLARLNKGWTRLAEHPKVRWRLASYAPHVHEHYDTWIKGSKAYLAGYPSFPVHSWQPLDPLPIPTVNVLNPQNSQAWATLALQAETPDLLTQTLYLDQMLLHLQSKEDKNSTIEILLKDALQEPFNFAGGLATLTLKWEIGELSFQWKDDHTPYQETVTFLLNTPPPLKAQTTAQEIFKSQFEVKLKRLIPLIAFVDDEEKTGVWSFNSDGTFVKEEFSSTSLSSLIVYDQGFEGYAIQTHIPTIPKEAEKKQRLVQELQPLLTQQTSLSPPLELLKQASKKAQLDFTTVLIDFFQAWNDSPQLLLKTAPASLEPLFKQIDWSSISLKEMKAVHWIQRLFQQLSLSMRQGEQFLTILQTHRWPFIDALQAAQDKKNDLSILSLLAQQIFSVIHDLPVLETTDLSPALLCAYFQLHGLDADLLDQIQLDSSHQSFTLETPLTSHLIPLSAPLKVEDQRPGMILEVEHNKMVQKISLVYYPTATGLKWPILNGSYQVRFQPEVVSIPYHVRLRQARQLTYPHSPQTYSYEADVLITGANESAEPFTLSMNHVYETWEGYRFYLSGVQGGQEPSIKRVQLAVNYDPAKYFLTYPGACILFLGIALLFWVRPYRKS